MKIIIVGSGNYQDYPEFCALLDPVIRQLEIKNSEKPSIITGRGNGTDKLSKRYATEKEYQYAVTDDLLHEVSAADSVVAFRNNGNKATKSIIDHAKNSGVPVTIFQINVQA